MRRAEKRLAQSAGRFQLDLMDSDLAPTGDSEISALPMSPILTAPTRIGVEGLDDQGLVGASARRHEYNHRRRGGWRRLRRRIP
jgi:hypothetical protein